MTRIIFVVAVDVLILLRGIKLPSCGKAMSARQVGRAGSSSG